MTELNDFFHWYNSRQQDWKDKPWLILGKGPSFAQLKTHDIKKYNIFGLNHVIRETEVDILHVIDLDVIENCADILADQAKYLLLPWYPHTDNLPGELSLDKLVKQIPVLSKFANENRLLWYNKTGTLPPVPIHGQSEPVRVAYFSAEAPYALLGMAGAKVIRSLGIDGGSNYSKQFKGLPTLLNNGRQSFDCQFDEIAKSIMKYNLDTSPLGEDSPIKIYVATTEEQMLSVKVLEYSIRKHASMSVELVPLHTSNIEIPQPSASENWPRTPFSFQRFIIPEIAGYCGRAIYLDSDMQVFSDIRELWCSDMNNFELLSAAPLPKGDRKPQYSVMLLDCSQLNWKISDIVSALDSGTYNYDRLMYDLCISSKQEASIPTEWNSLEHYQKGRTKLLHYTDMNTQPWIYINNKNGTLWVHDLLEAIDKGFISREYVNTHVKNGWVRPSLGYQVEHRIEDTKLLPPHVHALDKGYSPPYHKLHCYHGNPITHWLTYKTATLKRSIKNSLNNLKNALKNIKKTGTD